MDFWIGQLSPEVNDLLLGAGAGYTTGVAANISSQMLEAAGRKVAKKFRPKPQQKALNLALALALSETAESLGLQKENRFHFLKVFGAWLGREAVADELCRLIDPRGDVGVDMVALSTEFEDIGFAAEKLARELDFRPVVGFFIDHFQTAAARQPELQEQIKIGLLNQVVDNSRQQLGESMKQTVLLKEIKSGVAPDLSGLMEAYLKRLEDQFNNLSLQALDFRAADASACAASQMPLAQVYIHSHTPLRI